MKESRSVETTAHTRRSPGKALLAVATTALLALSGMVAGTSVANAAPATVEGASLEWGIKSSFRNYITSPVAKGSVSLLGNTTTAVSGAYSWTSGSGIADTTGSLADAKFSDDDGVHFQGHESSPSSGDYALDLSFSGLRVVVTSASAGEIRANVSGKTYPGGESFTLSDTAIAALDLSSVTPSTSVAGGVTTLTWTNVPSELTAAGVPAFADFYTEGTALDAATFSVPATEISPTVTVSKTADLDPRGETITVNGTGFLPYGAATSGSRPPLAGKFTGIYVAFGSYLDAWKPSENNPPGSRSNAATNWAVPAESINTVGGPARGAIELNPDGSFTATLNVTKSKAKELAAGNWGVVTYPGGGSTFAPFETFTPVTFLPETEVTPVAPTQSENTITLPSTPGVVYSVDGTAVSGTYTLTADATVTAAPADGYLFPAGATVSWQFLYSGPKPPFVDVAVGDKFFSDITWLKEQGLTTGYSDGTYRATNSVTRGAMVQMLNRAAGAQDFVPTEQNPYADVKPGDTFYKAIMWAWENEISVGVLNKTTGKRYFNQTEPITRGAMSAMLNRQFKDKVDPTLEGTPKTFTDVPSNHKFYEHIQWMSAYSITTGTGDGSTYSPGASTTRGAMAAFLHRVDNRLI